MACTVRHDSHRVEMHERGLTVSRMQRFGFESIDIGIDAPLDQSGRVRPLDEAHRISPRWLAGAMLTGLAGAAMMGGAVLGTIDSQAVSASSMATYRPPIDAIASNTRTISAKAGDETPERQDKLIKPVDIALAKRSFDAQAMVKSGERELVQTRRYTRVSAPLEVYGSAARDLPRFNPMLLISEANTNRNFNSVTTREDPTADVSISTSDLASTKASKANFVLADSEALMQATAAILQSGGASVGESPQTMLDRVMNADAEQSDDVIAFTPLPGSPFAKLEVRLVPENFAELGKLAGRDLAMLHREEVIAIGKDGSAAEAIAALDINGRVARAAERALVEVAGKEAARVGNRLKLRFARALGAAGRSNDLVNVTLYGDDQIVAAIGRKDDGSFAIMPNVEKATPPSAAKGDQLTVYASIYETALRQGVPRALVDELVRVYSYDVDFQRPVSSSDSIDFLYAEPEQGSDEQGELLHVGITVGAEEKNYYRFQTDDTIDFYDPKGRSGRKFLLRMPLPAGELRSGFGWRKHPILGYMKMHTGIDWSNKVGTPILAAGNGMIRKAAWDSGYGRRVEIDHANGYTTTYSHMSGFGNGIEQDIRVRQGQIIGYLGSSGLSTGPHLHYEVIVNDNFLDPMAIKLPRGKELQGQELTAFAAERARIDALMKQSKGSPAVESLASTNQ
jgi:murein DD-endopeptidase MepM/ murein hydrolase activator NlpD